MLLNFWSDTCQIKVIIVQVNTISAQKISDIQLLFHALYCVYRFIVRDFVYDTATIKEEKDEMGRLEIDMKKEFVSTISLLMS